MATLKDANVAGVSLALFAETARALQFYIYI